MGMIDRESTIIREIIISEQYPKYVDCKSLRIEGVSFRRFLG